MKGVLSWTLLGCAWMRGVGYRAQAARNFGHATLAKVAGVPTDASLAWEPKGCPVLPKLRVDELPGPSPPREKDGIQMLADMASFGSARSGPGVACLLVWVLVTLSAAPTARVAGPIGC